MKNSKLIATLLIASTFIFVDCSKSSDPAAPSIAGTWRLSDFARTDCTNSSYNVASSDYSGTNMTYKFEGSATSGTYVYGGYNKAGAVPSSSGTYSITSSLNMTLVGTSGTTTLAVSSLTATTMTWRYVDTYGAGCMANQTMTRL